MDGAHKSKRLYPSYTTTQLYNFLKSPNNSNAQQERFQLAIRQRDPASSDYVTAFVTPQL